MTSEMIEMIGVIAGQIEERIQRNFTVMPTITLADAATALNVSEEKVRQLCNEGKIPFIRMDRLYRIKPADLNAYLESNYHHA